MKESIIFDEINGTGIIHLNRPEALNALNLSMVELFLIQLNSWQKDKSIKRGLSRTHLVIVIGNTSEKIKNTIPIDIPIIEAKFQINRENKIFKGQNITAFAGIAYPEKFFQSLEEQGGKIVKRIKGGFVE